MTEPIPTPDSLAVQLARAQTLLDEIQRTYPWAWDVGYSPRVGGRSDRPTSGHSDSVGGIVVSKWHEQQRDRVRFAAAWLQDVVVTLEAACSSLGEVVNDAGPQEADDPDPTHVPLSPDELAEVHRYRKRSRG